MRCWHWAHMGSQYAARAGCRTCATHAAEEDSISSIIEELQTIAAVVKAWETRSHKHPDESKAFVESAIRSFFASAFTSYATTSGFRGHNDIVQQLDVVVVEKTSRSTSDTIDATFIISESQILSHIEVSYAGKGRHWSDLRRKLTTDLDKLEASIAADWKPWIGLALIGPGWGAVAAEIPAYLHSRYHGGVRQIGTGDERSWALLDALILPRLLLKKHVLYSGDNEEEPAFPVWAAHPFAEDDPVAEWRGLAIARSFALYYLQRFIERSIPHRSPAMAPDRVAANSGPPPNRPATTKTGQPFLFMSAVDGLPAELVQYVGEAVQPRVSVLEQPTCTRGNRYLMFASPASDEEIRRMHREAFS